MKRIISIIHRQKINKEGELRPTMIAISCLDQDELNVFTLKTETDELDFLYNKYPSSYRSAQDGEDLSALNERHIKSPKKGEINVQVPASYEGLQAGDVVVTTMGGSGDRFSAALARRGEEINAQLLRMPAFNLKIYRKEDDTKNDHLVMLDLFYTNPELFYDFRPSDRNLIEIKELFNLRQDTMTARMACASRVRQNLVGTIFLSEGGRYSEGSIEQALKEEQANNVVLQNILAEEKEINKRLVKAVHQSKLWQEIFEEIIGCGEVIAAGIISSIGDIRRFPSAAHLKSFCGVAVNDDGGFTRKKRGNRCTYNPKTRQSLYLLMDQFNRRPDSEWGKKFREIKIALRKKHPEVIIMENGKKKYTDGHVHKMAGWRAITKFVEMLYTQWTRLENAKQVSKKVA